MLTSTTISLASSIFNLALLWLFGGEVSAIALYVQAFKRLLIKNFLLQKLMPSCIYCSNKLLRHIQNSRPYWFCRYCWREVPLIEPQRESKISCYSIQLSQSLSVASASFSSSKRCNLIDSDEPLIDTLSKHFQGGNSYESRQPIESNQ